MNSMERIQATIAGKPLDRRAIVPVLSLYGARLTDCPLEQYYTDPAAYAQGQSAVRETFQPDVLCAPMAFALIGAAFGSELAILSTEAPNLSRPSVQSVEEWDRLVPPDPDVHPRLLYFRDAIQQMAAEHRGQVPIAMVVPIPADIPELVMGLETWLETVLFDPAGARRVMDKVIPFYIRLINGFFDAGATFVVMPCGLASPAIVTREIVTNFTRPILEQVLAQLKGPVVLHNVGAPILAHLDLLAGLPSVAAFIVDQLDDLAQSRRIIGPDSVLFGGLDCINIGRMPAAEVEDRCRAILEERRHDARFILGTSGPDVAWNTPPENIHAMRKAAESFGRIDI
ncbi:MAG: uroporphyrinogen decarboxylase family protein [Candidatus Xenobiia bacterium LiM19]